MEVLDCAGRRQGGNLVDGIDQEKSVALTNESSVRMGTLRVRVRSPSIETHHSSVPSWHFGTPFRGWKSWIVLAVDKAGI